MKPDAELKTGKLTITDGAAFALRFNGSRAGQRRADDWITDHCSLLQKKAHKDLTRT